MTQFNFLLDEENAGELVKSIPYADYLGIKIETNLRTPANTRTRAPRR